MTNLMKTILTAFVITFSGMFATTASAMSPKPGQACIMWICWDKPNQWKPNYGGRADADIETNNETEVAMWTPTYELKAWYCMKGNMGKQMQHKDSTCIGGTPRPVYGRRSDLGESLVGETTIAMMTPEMLKAWDATLTRSTTYGSLETDTAPQSTIAMWGNHGGNIFDGNSWKNFWNKENWHVDKPELNFAEDTQLAFNRRGSTCSLNPYGRRSTYCNEGEVEAPLQSEVTASFGSCLLDDAPLDIEQLVDCRSDACLGRKFYYGSFGKVGR